MSQGETKSIIIEHPGILQSDLHYYTDLDRTSIQKSVLSLYKKREIRREKWKNSNKLYIIL